MPDNSTPIFGQAVSWWSVHEYVVPRLIAGSPLLGTPAWVALDDDNPAKLAAVLDGGRHWALRMETCQEGLADASKAVADSTDWRQVAQEILQRTGCRKAGTLIERRPA